MQKLLNGAVTLAMLFGLSLSANAQTMVQQIVIGNASMPSLNVRADEDLVLHVVNPTDEAALVMLPDMGLNYWIPANSEQKLFVDISPVQNHEMAYRIVDADGNLMASGQVVNSGSIQVALAELEQSLIASSASYLITAQDLEDEEPVYYDTPRSSAVRGYW